VDLLLIAKWLATVVCIVFLVYGAWLCLREWALAELEQAPQQDDLRSDAQTEIDTMEETSALGGSKMSGAG
jgi:hypothetical protein